MLYQGICSLFRVTAAVLALIMRGLDQSMKVSLHLPNVGLTGCSPAKRMISHPVIGHRDSRFAASMKVAHGTGATLGLIGSADVITVVDAKGDCPKSLGQAVRTPYDEVRPKPAYIVTKGGYGTIGRHQQRQDVKTPWFVTIR